MKKISLYILDILGYAGILFGIGGVILGLILISAQDTSRLKSIAFLIGGFITAATGIVFIYLAAEKNNKKFKGRLLEWLIISILPPW